MKGLLTTIMLLVSITMLSSGKYEVETRYFRVDCEDQLQTNAIIIEDNATNTYSISLKESLGLYKRWSASGNIVIIDSTATSAKFYSNGPLKGRIYYYFDDDPLDSCKCGLGSVSIDVYKHFDAAAKYGVEIIGPDCITDGDSVVFSVNPILTANLHAGIGMDLYNWNIFDSLSAPYVKSIPYVSGDSSSVTFTVGKMTGNDSITIRVGLANEEYRIVKYLGKSAPMPIVHDTCLPYNRSSFEVSVFNEDYPDLVYSWEYDPKWSTASFPTMYDGNQQKRYHAVLYPDSGGVGTITVTASYGNDDACVSASKASFKLFRSWGTDANVSIEEDCAHNGGDYVHFKLSTDQVPDGVYPTWELPDGWEVYPNILDHSCDYLARPINSTNYIDTIEVWGKSCSKKDSCLAIVHIAPARVDSITNLTCLKSDSIYTFKVERLGRGPAPTGYQWYINGEEVNGSDSIFTHRFTSGMTSLAVRSLGMYDCHADSTQIALTFQPTPPNSIIASDTCLFSGQPIETTLSIQTPIPGQTYHWSVPQGWNIAYEESDSSSVTYSASNANSGSYPIYVYASGLGDCQNSEPKMYVIKVDTIEWKIKYEYSRWTKRYDFLLVYQEEAPEQLVSADWYVNGSLVVPGPSEVLSRTSLPQTLRAEFTIGGCDYVVYWSEVPQSAQRKTSAPQLLELPDLSLTPNPTKDQLRVQWGVEGNFTCMITDVEGHLFVNEKCLGEGLDIDTSKIPNGVYSVVISGGRFLSSRQLIVQH